MSDPQPPSEGRPALTSGPRPTPAARQPRAARARGWRWLGWLIGALGGLAVVAGIVGLVGLYGAYRHYAADLPDLDGLKHYQPRVMSRVFDDDAGLLAEFATERRIFVPYAAIPDLVKQAFVSAEDQNFWTHRGVDPLAILRAALTDLGRAGEKRRPMGASTITQQVAKNMLLGNEVSLSRKIREAILALRIERTLSKQHILELYLNEIYLGQQSYGVAAAALAYFNTSLDEVTLPEAALLAALPKAPNNYNPFRDPEAARERRNWVLERMADDHAITQAQARAAQAEPLLPAAYHAPQPLPGAGFAADEIKRQLIARFGAETTSEGGLIVRSSLVPALQRDADHVLQEGLLAYDRKRGGWRGPVGRLATPGWQQNWAAALAETQAPPGMPPGWALAVVLNAGDGTATLGWRPPEGAPAEAPLLLADLAWARTPHPDGLGPAPRRVSEVLHPGDVVMVEPAAAIPAGPHRPARPARLLLRQIPAVEGALVALDPQTGRVLALAGGWSHAMSQFDRATQANRQPGSSFKPFVYLTAMEQGIPPSQQFLDAPFVVDLGAAGRWRPNNYERDFNGPVSLHEALMKSLNLVTLRVADRIGVAAVAQTAIGFHIVDSMPQVLPAALGAVDTTVMRMAGAYAGLDTGGREVIPSLIDSVQDRDGHLLWRSGAIACESCGDDPAHGPILDDTRKQVADPASTFQVVTMMQDVIRRGTGTAAGAGLNRPLAGKTGTTQDFNDAWFAGFSPDLVTIVWVGFDTPATLGEGATGGVVAAPIWHDFMAAALHDRPALPFVPPPDVTLAPWNGGSFTDAFKTGQQPGASSPLDAGGMAAQSAAPATPDAGAAAAPSAATPAPDSSAPVGTPASGTAASGGLDSHMGGLY